MATTSVRKQRWPYHAGRARQRAQETAADQADQLRKTLELIEKIQEEAHKNPALVERLAILAQRDIALAIANLTSIQTWMAEAQYGREPEEANEARSPP